ncbi:PDZ/DHR/GLGF [Mycobacteroides abscessus subsp. abscessus]|nr:PDZ/DHR/GLGF [Mycobacteroides abscessus subsp. abscessus]
MPAANCAEAKTDGGQGLTLVKVGTLTEAVDGLNALNRGEQPPSC